MESLLQSAPSPAHGAHGPHSDMVYQATTVVAIILVLVTIWVF